MPRASAAVLDDVRAVLAAEHDSACLLDGEGRILFCNGAWDRFAVENGGAPGALARAVVGRRWQDFILGEDAARALVEAFRRAAAGEELSIHTECNSPAVGRLLVCRFQPVQAGRSEPVIGVAVVHHVVRAVPIAELHRPHPPRHDLYLDARGLAHMCAVCRRVRRRREPERWDFVPEYVRHYDGKVSHGLCGTCCGLRYAPSLVG